MTIMRESINEPAYVKQILNQIMNGAIQGRYSMKRKTWLRWLRKNSSRMDLVDMHLSWPIFTPLMWIKL